MNYTIEEIKDLLEEYIDKDYWDNGCFVDGVWLSVNNILNILKRG